MRLSVLEGWQFSWRVAIIVVSLGGVVGGGPFCLSYAGRQAVLPRREKEFFGGRLAPFVGVAAAVKSADKEITGAFLATLARVMSGVSVRWVDCEPDTCQRVYFANHTSHLDALVLWSALPRRVRNLTRPVAAKDYWDRGMVRRYIATVFDALLIDRKNIKVHSNPVNMLLEAIGQTHSLIVFPEGGRNTSEEMQDFKSGLYYLCKKRPDLEAVPTYIDNMNRILPRGEYLPVPLLTCITFGPPLWLEEGETKHMFLSRAKAAIEALKERDN